MSHHHSSCPLLLVSTQASELHAALSAAVELRDDALSRLQQLAGMAEAAHAAASEQEEKAGAFYGERGMQARSVQSLTKTAWPLGKGHRRIWHVKVC